MQKRILLVEDSPAYMQLMQEALEARGYSIVTAEDGEEALEQARKHRPDLILLDVVLPKKNGYQVCRQLKTESDMKSIPIVMVSSKTQEFDRYWGMKQGADGYITKPFGAGQIVAEVESRL
jgi:DNA-binding response OmpR family regulator